MQGNVSVQAAEVSCGHGMILARCLRSAILFGLIAVSLAGCSHFKKTPDDKYVYVTAKETFLRDRVAAVSNRTGTVTNGEKLVVLDRARRFVKVRTPDGAVGWIEEKMTADQATANRFESLGRQHANDPVVAQAVARDEVYLHVAPGREAERFYRLNEGEAMSLLARAIIEKVATPGAAAKPAPAKPGDPAPAGPPPPAMEDWWLVRDSKGQTGWIYSHMIDVAAPDALVRYAEGQRIVGAYLIAHVDDPDSGVVENGQTVTSIPEYVTVLSPYKAGLPYDFDQVRVFTWNVKMHRYETGFREHFIEGYLPVVLADKADPYGKSASAQEKLPTFTYRVLAAGEPTPTPDPQTGELKPGRTIEKTYRLEGNICRRILQPGTQPPAEAHTEPEKPVPHKKK
jgi:SH3-like domain-containing protein